MQKVLLVSNAPHDATVGPTLTKLGYEVVAHRDHPSGLPGAVEHHKPDVIIVATNRPSEETLVSIAAVMAASPRAVVVFAKEGTRDLIRRATECGVAAYVVDGWSPERITAIIEAAAARFDAYQALRRELDSTRSKLSERKLIEKAKGLVMQQRGLSEEQAYGALRKMAMDQNLALAEVARRVIAVAQLLV